MMTMMIDDDNAQEGPDDDSFAHWDRCGSCYLPSAQGHHECVWVLSGGYHDDDVYDGDDGGDDGDDGHDGHDGNDGGSGHWHINVVPHPAKLARFSK